MSAELAHDYPLTNVAVAFLDLRVSDPAERKDYLSRIEQILVHGRIINGPEVDAFEHEVARHAGVRFAVGVGSGTSALILALKAAGIGTGDKVITSCLSFVGTANAIAMAGAEPIFVDVTEDLVIDPECVAAAVSEGVRAIMPVHFTGRICAMDQIMKVADQAGCVVIEDAAPAFGARFFGCSAGSIGHLGCISMNPMKVLAACGEAGVVLTNSEKLHAKMLELRYHGMIDKEICGQISLNARLDTIQAALLLARLARIESVIERRRRIAANYSDALRDVVRVPGEEPGCRHVYYTYTILADERDALAEYLAAHSIETKKYHRQLIPEHPVFPADLDPFPTGRAVVKKVLCLPMHQSLTDTQIDHVIDRVRRFFGR
jgi:dTDP-4-amino-4,6-dideoxygalactose transaminase